MLLGTVVYIGGQRPVEVDAVTDLAGRYRVASRDDQPGSRPDLADREPPRDARNGLSRHHRTGGCTA